VSIFVVPGNHEQEEGWHLDDTGDPATSQPVIGTNARKKFYPNPVPDTFYSGNQDTYPYLDGDQLHENYYAWTWGDALFVVIDPFWYTTVKPYTGNMGGGESSDTGSGDRWDWTLGEDQFNWLKTTLQNSTAAYKFVFAHHMVGGSQDYVREGANATQYVEWGGYNEDGTTWGWDSNRVEADFGSDPIHDFLVDNNVSAFFKGHDHQYAYEERDGVVYQTLPAAGFSGNGFNLYTTGDRNTIQALPSPGHLKVTVNSTQATVDYIGTTSGTSNYVYTIEPNISGPTHVLTTAVDPAGGGTIDPSAGTHTYPEGQVVNVTATPNQWYEFDHWSGACTGNGTCSVTMDTDKSVTAHFVAIPTHTLTMAVDPTGGGTTNPTVGVHTYEAGSVVNVTATPNTGYEFDHWSGDCTGAGSCSVTLDADKSVTAHFAPLTFDLTITVDPTGAGTTNPIEGVHTYAYGSVVNLTATPNTGYAFSSWSGDCSGAGSCSVTMTADRNVTANFSTVTGNVASAATPSDDTLTAGESVVVTINVDMSGMDAPDNKLGSFTGSLAWDPAILAYDSYSGPLAGFTGAVNTGNVGSGQLSFNGANATGATGNIETFEFTFHAIGPGTSDLDLEYSAMAAATTFTNLLPLLTITDGQVTVSTGTLGDVNGDGLVDSTDALIVLSADAAMDTSAFCPMNCGDVNGDEAVNSTDALIILSYDAGMSVPFPVGTGACPSTVTPPPGCNP
jgi:hypothetical protein